MPSFPKPTPQGVGSHGKDVLGTLALTSVLCVTYLACMSL